jgi:hypothetical protein
MRKRLIPLVALLTTVGCCDTFTDHHGLTISYTSLKALVSENTKRHFSMIGKVQISSTPQGITMSSDTMDIDAAPDAKSPKSYVVQTALAKGQVRILKLVKNAKGTQTTQIDGAQANYTVGTKESVVKMTGPVTLTSLDEKQRQTMLATGKSAVAYLEPTSKSSMEDGLHRAQLDGDVHLTLTQRDPKTQEATVIRTTSDHVLIENIGKGRRVTLTGEVKIHTEPDQDMSGIQKAVFTVDDQGRFTVSTTRKQ